MEYSKKDIARNFEILLKTTGWKIFVDKILQPLREKHSNILNCEEGEAAGKKVVLKDLEDIENEIHSYIGQGEEATS